ncbi:neutral zinc metallopeptidase [Nonomuraea rubra]|uniref:Putative metalloprotease n=1 Tax=Nonomuraea rubra TaxID=46180 RepID=A0A7X0NR58_9ACTN|nr:neutral zinc metallopeptidase [Nonomuraea rubra]MBB6548029.1 putative metalloprotease [Nonomuraea rubra]
MRIPRLALMAGAMAGVLFAGTAPAAASSAPSYKPVLTKNALYKTGKLGVTACEEPQVQNGTVEEAEYYFQAVMECLDKAWSPIVKKAGYRFTKSKLTVFTKLGVNTPCGRFEAGAQAMYCEKNKGMYFFLSEDIVEEPTDLALMQVLAHEYGHHVQELTGIGKETTKRFYYKTKVNDSIMEGVRRSELQAQCLSAAFVGRVWNSLGRPDTDWSILLKGSHNPVAALGVRNGGDESHGSQAGNKYWLERGFKAQSASACNTWTAPKKRVY